MKKFSTERCTAFAWHRDNPWLNYFLVLAESVFASGLMALPIMSFFFMEEVGLDFGQIALAQSIFTLVTIFANAPFGLLADCLSRKKVNLIGDFGIAVTHLFYAFADSFLDVVVCESLLGVFGSMSKGVDMALISHFVSKIHKGHDDSLTRTHYQRSCARLQIAQSVFAAILMVLGNAIGAIDYRLCVALSGVGYLIGAIAELFIKDDSPRLHSKTVDELHAIKTSLRLRASRLGLRVHIGFAFSLIASFLHMAYVPLAETWSIAKESLRDRRLGPVIIATTVGRQIGHAIVWIYSPMLVSIGVPAKYVGLAWLLVELSHILGSSLAMRFSRRLSPHNRLAITAVSSLAAILVLAVDMNIYNFWIYYIICIGLTWVGASLSPLVQIYADKEKIATINSICSVGGNIIYAIAGCVVGRVADVGIQAALFIDFIIFLPLCIYAYILLRKNRKLYAAC